MRVPRVLAALLALVVVPLAGAASHGEPQRWCRAPSGAGWVDAFGHHIVALSRRVSLVPLAGGRDGKTFFADEYSPAFSGIVRVVARSGQTTQVARFPHPEREQAEAAFDGRWLVWTVYRSPADPTNEGFWAWDSTTGKTWLLGRGDEGRSYAAPAVHDGYAVWDTRHGLVAADLGTGRKLVLAPGLTAPPLLVDGDHAVWQAGGSPVAADVRTGERVAVPVPMRGRVPPVLGSDASASAFVARGDTLWLSPALGRPAVPVFGAPAAIDESVSLGGGYVSFGVQPHSYLADTRSGRYVELPTGGGAGILDGRALVFLEPSRVKAAHAISDVAFIPLASLPRFGACSG
jgi:hypothetical protein